MTTAHRIEFPEPALNLEAEQGVLGAILIEPEAFDEVSARIRAGDFYQDRHRELFEAMGKLVDRGEPIDTIALSEMLGGDVLEYLMTLVETTPTAANVGFYASKVVEAAKRRAIRAALVDGLRDLGADAETPVVLERIDARVTEALRDRGAREPRPLRELAHEALERLQRAESDAGGFRGVLTGIDGLDALTGGLRAGELIVLAGRPSMGKTALALSILRSVAERGEGGRALFFSVEMTRDQIADRLASMASGLALTRIRGAHRAGADPGAKLTGDEWSRLTDGLARASRLEILVDDSASIGLGELRSKARRAARQAGGLGLIVVDYLQLLEGAEETRREADRRDLQIARVTRGLKAIGKELGVPVLALSQLNREVERRANRRP
ncbi:MAG: AAA family ATPase, partial [Myxococcales bacterium]|nr:AAA family ATPase [Myxococcales bacterium]